MIKAVFYDLGDIFFEAHLWREWNFLQIKEMGLFKGSFAEFYNLYEEFLEPVYVGGKNYDTAFDEFLIFLKVPDRAAFKAESFLKKKQFEETRQLYDGVFDTLATLQKEGILNVVISDNEATEAEVRQKVIARFNINEFLFKVITSKDLGVKKPDPVIFQKALGLLGLTEKETIFVAHDKDEIDGAQKINLRVIEFNNYLQQANEADYRIKSFSEIISIVRSL